MADELPAKASPPNPVKQELVADAHNHYEEVSEYRIGEGAPPLFLVIAFIFIVVWAMFSWIPFFGY